MEITLRFFTFFLLVVSSLSSCKPSEEPPVDTQTADTLALAVNTPPPEHAGPVIGDTNRIDLSYLMGKFDPAIHPDFTMLEDRYATRKEMYLRKDTYQAFKGMHAAAQADGIRLEIWSATRNFDYQKAIWQAKWTGSRRLSNGENAAAAYPDPVDRARKILEYSSMPGTSRHHWGTDIDLNALNNAYFESGVGKAVYEWLQTHAADHGFCQPYTAGRRHGYLEEKWHWTYLPVANICTRRAKKIFRADAIEGFSGAEAAVTLKMVDHYVLGIHPTCLP